MEKIVIALGGNALLKKDDKPTIKVQLINVARAMTNLLPIIKDNKVVITHGSGPQVGIMLLRNEIVKNENAFSPLDVIDAEIEGQIGYLIQQNLQNLFAEHRVKKSIATILTQVLVDKKDSAFRNPTKFIGPFYTKEEADRIKHKFVIKEDIGRGYRRVVASPMPIEIIESQVIKKMLKENIVVIAAGGGGIPVAKTKGNKLEGVEAVIDKDLASACLANSIKADILLIVTDIDRAYINYKKPNQQGINKINAGELEKHYKQGHFPPGSMGPKIQASLQFIKSGGKEAIITDIENIGRAMNGKAGTMITK